MRAWNAAQMNVARVIRDVVKSVGMDTLALQIALMVGMVESQLQNLAGGNGTSVGVFQQTSPYGSGRNVVATSAKYFLKGKSGIPGLDQYPYHSMDPGVAAQAVQKSAYPDRYGLVADEAAMLVGVIAADGIVGSGGDPYTGTQGPGTGTTAPGQVVGLGLVGTTTTGAVIGETNTVDVSSLPYKFNPIAHPTLLPRRVDYDSSDTTAVYDSLAAWNAEIMQPTTFKNADKFKELRQGRITMSDTSMAYIGTPTFRWGFRFQYNPSSITGGQQVNNTIIVNPADKAKGYYMQEGVETITFTLLLNRVPDVCGFAPAGEYNPILDKEQWAGIQERGTNYDLEYLYRICNGVTDTQARKNTGDIGILMPNPANLILGPGLRFYGAVTAINVQDFMFSKNMVPVLSNVSLTFMSYLNLSPADTTQYESDLKLVPIANDPTSTTTYGLGDAAAGTNPVTPAPTSETDPGPGTTKWSGRSLLKDYVLADADQIAAAKSVKSAMTYQPAAGSVPSDHPSRAVDFMVSNKSEGDTIAAYARDNHELWNLSYIIWNRKIISNKDGWKAWRPYTGTDNPHTDHVHVSWNLR